MAEVEGLVTVVDEDPEVSDGDGFTALLYAVLADGSRVLVLDDRGWAQTRIVSARPPDVAEACDSTLDRQDIEDTAKMVVGPDEPPDDSDHESEAAAYWEYLAGILVRQGVATRPADLRLLPHDVELSEPLAARVR